MKKVFLIFITIKLFALNILVLNSYSPNLSWTHNQTLTIIHMLKHKNLTNVNVEFMDTKKFAPTKQYFNTLFKFYNIKYKKPFDIIITTDDNALNFVRYYKNTYLFKNAKVFFEGVNNLSLYNKLDKNIYAGIFEKKRPLKNLELAKKINPDLEVVYVLSDTSTSGNKTIKQYKKAFSKIKNLKFVYIHTSSMKEILNKLKNYNQNSVLMMLTFGRIKQNNNVLTPYQTAQIISKNYNNPILVHNDVYTNIPNTNIVGGDVTDAKQQATLNIQKLFEYLKGTPMNKIGFELNNANVTYLNVKNLLKFGVNAQNINISDVKLINQPTSFYEIYRTQILSAIIIFIITIIFLILLAKKNRELYKYSQEIKNLNQSLEKRIANEIAKNQKQQEILFQQSKLASMGEMIGAIAHQWRQPLNTLGLNTQLLVEDYFDGLVNEDYILEYEKKQMNIVKFMSKTIDDFRNFFVQDKEKTKFRLKDAIDEVVKLIDKQLKNYNITLIIKADESEIEGYKNELKQVLLNLINNSKDAILANNIQNGKIEIIAFKNTIKIKDNAGGIPDNIKNRIFEPYFTTKDNGTGIGLYMSKIIIEEHLNSKLYFENVEDGAEFIIDFTTSAINLNKKD